MDVADKAFEQWLSATTDEILYWKNYLASKGGDYPEDFQFRLRHDTFISDRDHRLSKRIGLLPRNEVKILDVGSGPLTNLGKKHPSKMLHVTASDPLADAYNALLLAEGIAAPVPTQFSDAENLSAFFDPEAFDVVHCSNALDHSYDPVAALFQMLNLVKRDGFVHLGHFENEAVSENYTGFHQWNFTEKAGDFIIWNQKEEISLSSLVCGAAILDVERTDSQPKNWIIVTLRRNEGTELLLKTRKAGLGSKFRVSIARNLASSIMFHPDLLAAMLFDSPHWLAPAEERGPRVDETKAMDLIKEVVRRAFKRLKRWNHQKQQ